VHQVGYLVRLYWDARSAKHQNIHGNLRTWGQIAGEYLPGHDSSPASYKTQTRAQRTTNLKPNCEWKHCSCYWMSRKQNDNLAVRCDSGRGGKSITVAGGYQYTWALYLSRLTSIGIYTNFTAIYQLEAHCSHPKPLYNLSSCPGTYSDTIWLNRVQRKCRTQWMSQYKSGVLQSVQLNSELTELLLIKTKI